MPATKTRRRMRAVADLPPTPEELADKAAWDALDSPMRVKTLVQHWRPKITKQMVYSWIEKGLLPTVRNGRTHYIRKVVFERFMAENQF